LIFIHSAKWYRFRSHVGNKIPERAEGESVEINRCGTVKPIYISGLNQHPTKGKCRIEVIACNLLIYIISRK